MPFIEKTNEEFIEECIEETDPIEEVVEDSTTLQRSPAKKKRERSQKQIESLKKAQAARVRNIAARKQVKKEAQMPKVEEEVVEKPLRPAPKAAAAPAAQPHSVSKLKPRRRRQKIIIQNDESSSSDDDVIVIQNKRKKKRSKPRKAQVVASSESEEEHYDYEEHEEVVMKTDSHQPMSFRFI